MRVKITSLSILSIMSILIFACQRIDSSSEVASPIAPVASSTALSVTATPYDRISCINPEINISDFNHELSVVLTDKINQIFLYNLMTKEKSKISIMEVDMDAIVSPNFQVIVFVYHTDDGVTNLAFADNTGSIIDTLSLNGWLEVVRWLNDFEIILTTWENNLYQEVSILSFQNFDIRNIPLSYSSLPDFDDINKLTNWWPLKISPNHDFSYFIYPSTTKGGNVVLWNNEKGEKIAEFPSPNPFTYQPKWLRDGERVLFVGQEEGIFLTGDEKMDFYIFSSKGELIRISTMSKERERVRIYSFDISPDQTHVAFWVGFDNELPKLSLLDINTGTITSFCIEGSPGVLTKMFWSPNNKYLLLKSNSIAGIESVTIVDIEKMTVYTIPDMEAFTPIGWMIAPLSQ